MTTALTIVLILLGAAMAFSVAIRLLPYPLRRLTLDERKLEGVFGGLIHFGKDGAYVEFDQKSTGDHILFTKRYRESNQWILAVTVSSSHISGAFLNSVKSAIMTVGSRLEFEEEAEETSNQIKFSLRGEGLQNYNALESVARLLVRKLGHPDDAKYRIEFRGPYDDKAANKYYSDLVKQWKK